MTAPRRRTARLAGLLLPIALLAACSSGSPGGSPSGSTRSSGSTAPHRTRTTAPASPPAAASAGPSSGTAADWPQYHRSADRSGSTAAPLSLPLRRAWQAKLDGAVYGEPLVVGGAVLVATENDSVYALDPASGRVRWRTHLGTPQPQSGLPCGDIDPLGITGTPAYDPATGSVFAVAETRGGHHTLWALSAATGTRRWHRGLDVAAGRNRYAEQQRSALLVTAGRVISTFGGLAGDCDNYVGYATSVATTGSGRITQYAVPTEREAGMWSPAGAVTGPSGTVYVASGNGAELDGRWDRSDSVTELAPASLHRVAVFAPATWADDNRQDLDLGSSSPVPVAGRIVIAGKRGTVYLVPASLGGVGGDVARATGCAAYGGAARSGSTVVMPCRDGIRVLLVGRSSLRWGWTASGRYGSPVIAGSQVVLADRDNGDLNVFSLASGKLLDRRPAGELTHFPSQTVSGGRVFVPTLTGVTAFTGS